MKTFAWIIRLFALCAVLGTLYVWVDTAPAKHQGAPKYRAADDPNLPPVFRSAIPPQPAIWKFECEVDKDCGEPRRAIPEPRIVVATPVPEPGTLGMVGIGLAFLWRRRMRR